MFDKLKKAFSSAAKSIGQKEITEKVLDDTLVDLQIALLESDVAQEVVDDLSERLKKELLGLKLEKGQEAGQIIEAKLQEAVAGIFARAGRFDLVERIRAKKEARQGPYVIVFLGINGTGKTTTVAKIGNLLRKSGLSLVVAAGDTHRAGAIEQLTQHAERLSLKVIAQRYGADPSAVGRDAVDYAKKHYVDAVLIDTAGRMQTSKNLMDEMSKIVRVVKPDAKIFVGDSLAGNDTINQAREFFQYTNFDGAILTKIDADAKGGSAISIAHITSRPIAYIGVGQGYDDMIPFDPDKFIRTLFGSTNVNVQDLMSAPQESAQPPIEEKVKERAVAVASPIGLPQAQRSEQDVPVQKEPEYSPPPAPVQASKPPPPPQPPEPQPVVQEQREERKSRFGGLFGRKKEEEGEQKQEKDRDDEQQRKKEEEKRRKREEEERRKREEEERKKKEKEEKKKRKDDKDTKKDEVVYLTDEDIEDLLK
ncbi:MAG: signal recognition particle-docking protein FtsY [Nitrososphaera sp.]|jgi:fused signal recognition particle receptor